MVWISHPNKTLLKCGESQLYIEDYLQMCGLLIREVCEPLRYVTLGKEGVSRSSTIGVHGRVQVAVKSGLEA